MCQSHDEVCCCYQYFESHHCHYSENSKHSVSFLVVLMEVEQVVSFVCFWCFRFDFLEKKILSRASHLLLLSYLRYSYSWSRFYFSASSFVDSWPTRKKIKLMQLWDWTGQITWLLPMCAIKFWYSVAAITIASSGDWQTKPWHSNCLATLGDFITTANSGECNPEDNLRLSAALWNKWSD